MKPALTNTKHAGQWKIIFLLPILLGLTSGFCIAAQQAPQTEVKNASDSILVLASYSAIPWTQEIIRGIEEVVEPSNYSLKIEYLDSKTYTTEQYKALLKQLMEYKYKSLKFPVVLTIDNAALSFFIQNKSIFHNTNLVFCGVNNFSPDMLAGKRNYTGISEVNGYHNTLECALKIQKKAKAIYIITDNTPTSYINLNLLKFAAGKVAPKVPLKLFQGLSEQQAAQKLEKVSPDDIVILLSFWKGKDGKPISDKSIRKVLQKSPAPIFSDHSWMLDYGLTGGFCVDGVTHGRQAAELALKVLSGHPAANLPVKGKSLNAYRFNYTLLKRYGISPSELPRGSVLVNAPIPFYQINKPLLYILIISLTVFGLLAAFLVIIVRQKHRTLDEETRIRKLYLTLTENIDLGICMINSDFEIMMCNNAFKTLFDCTNPLGKKCHNVCADYANPCPDCPGAEVLATGKKLFTRISHQRPDGKVIPISVHTFPIDFNDGSRGFIEVTESLEQENQTREQIDEIEKKFFTLFNSVSEMIIVHDPESGLIIDVNTSATQRLGYSREELINSPIGLVSNNSNNFTNKKALKAIQNAARGNTQFFEWQARTKAGEVFWIDVSLQKVLFGDAVRVMSFSRDIEQKKKNEKLLQIQNQQHCKAQKAEAVAKLAGGVAHDINNLLGGILGGVEVLKSSNTGINRMADPDNILNMIIQTTQRATELTDKLLALSSRELVLLRETNVHDLLQSFVQIPILRNNADIETEFKLAASRYIIKGDPTQLRNMFRNLIDNACEAMPAGGKLRISSCNATLSEADVQEDSPHLICGDYLIIDIQDTGGGIRKADLDRIFEPFYTTKSTIPGKGLGLPSAKGVALSHKGDITLRSSFSHGSTFSVFLPLTTNLSQYEPLEMSLHKLPLAEKKNINKSKMNALIIDDETPIRDSLKPLLAEMGYSCIEASNGEEGFLKFKEHSKEIEFVLLDLVMPQMDGEACLKQILHFSPSARIILLSGKYPANNFEHRDKIFGFIKKPYTRDQLQKTIRRALGEDE